ncbi:MAG TPA: sugar kinase [Povalibacter sp.]|uniref:sugar kinase n=1 Tax=Povalibacter sp. TaxID=1962978 RepID=UPI002C013B0B|nr:sugar kinase [Povalibacter sp.]HMN44010.1 sugar kinase [Povalibacter sp.]
MTRSILCFGEVLLRLSAPGKQLLLQTGGLEAHVGGAEANVAVSLSRLGHRTAVATSLPDNALGQACIGELRRHGVDTSAVKFGDGRLGLYFLTHGAGQRPAEVLYDRAQSAFAIAPADTHDWNALLQDTQWLHVSGITPAVSAAGADAALRAMQAARAMNVNVSFDCNFRAKLWGARAPQAPEILGELCRHADLIFGDDRDLAFILGFDAGDVSAMEKRRRAAAVAFETFRSLRWIAYTERTRHSVDSQQLAGTLHTANEVFTTRPYPLQGIVDRIGAGDAFAAGILHGLIRGMTPQATVDFATAAGCLKHTVPGDFNLLGAADIELFLSDVQTDVRR